MVERFIECTVLKGLNEVDLRQDVYNDIIMELEGLLNHMMLRT